MADQPQTPPPAPATPAPANTPKGDTGTRVAFAFLEGLLLAIMIPTLFFIVPVQIKEFMALFIFLAVPLAAYVSSLAFFSLLQFLQCGRIAFGQVAAISGLTPLFALLFGAIAYYVPLLGAPVHAIIPSTSDPDETAMIKRIGGHSFYTFWGGVYAITVGSGLLASCP
jgi:hypothetical protein